MDMVPKVSRSLSAQVQLAKKAKVQAQAISLLRVLGGAATQVCIMSFPVCGETILGAGVDFRLLLSAIVAAAATAAIVVVLHGQYEQHR